MLKTASTNLNSFNTKRQKIETPVTNSEESITNVLPIDPISNSNEINQSNKETAQQILGGTNNQSTTQKENLDKQTIIPEYLWSKQNKKKIDKYINKEKWPILFLYYFIYKYNQLPGKDVNPNPKTLKP